MTMQPGRGTINLERGEKRSHPDGELESDRTGESDGESEGGGGLIARCDACAVCGPGSNCAVY